MQLNHEPIPSLGNFVKKELEIEKTMPTTLLVLKAGIQIYWAQFFRLPTFLLKTVSRDGSGLWKKNTFLMLSGFRCNGMENRMQFAEIQTNV